MLPKSPSDRPHSSPYALRILLRVCPQAGMSPYVAEPVDGMLAGPTNIARCTPRTGNFVQDMAPMVNTTLEQW